MANYTAATYLTGVKTSFESTLSALHDKIETLDDTTETVLNAGINRTGGFGDETTFEGWLLYK